MSGQRRSSPYDVAALGKVVRELRKELVDKHRELLQKERQIETVALDLETVLDSEKLKSKQLRTAYIETVRLLMRVAKIRDQETGAHLDRIAAYVRLLAVELGLRKSKVDYLSMASSLHDIGKIGISDSILLNKGPLEPEERRIMQQHTVIGAEMLEDSPVPLLRTAREISLTHHENWDGSGYPRGLVGSEIPLSGRLVRIADQYDALRSKRTYKDAFSHEKSVEIITKGDGQTAPSNFDPDLLKIFEEKHMNFAEIAARIGPWIPGVPSRLPSP